MLTTKDRQILKAKAHNLKPVVMMGANGLSEAVFKEIDLALKAHELIKVKIQSEDREEKNSLTQEIANQTGSEIVQVIGNILVLFRKNPE